MNLYAGIKRGDGANRQVCDLRSDTVTRPSPEMRAAMTEAAVGDDVYGDDPSINRLEAALAELLGKQAAVFFPSGTQSNLAAMMSHCGRGDEIIVGEGYHTFAAEAGGASVLAGIMFCPIASDATGAVSAQAVAAAIKPDDPHYPISRLLCLENTVSGSAIPLAQIAAPAAAARDQGLAVHLDGARFFNAVTALGCRPNELAEHADTVSICLSKGLGAPAGSVLVGDAATMAKARRNRKMLGGGMRQAGILAAAGLYALDHHVADLAIDHQRAARLADALRALETGTVQLNTNMVFFTPPTADRTGLQTHLEEAGILTAAPEPTMRLVLHRDVSDDLLDQTIAAFAGYFRR